MRGASTAALDDGPLGGHTFILFASLRRFSNSRVPDASVKPATREEAIAAWTELKELDVPKDYVSWVNAREKRKGKKR